MFGQNPKKPAIFNSGTTLEVKKIFNTIQGEGPFVGMPAIFIRLSGCNLACNFCDTEFDDFDTLTIDKIIEEINKFYITSNTLIVITGGEPFRQNIEPLCSILLKLGHTIQIETNGTLYRDIPNSIHIVCSPKAQNNGYSLIREDLLPKLQAVKFLIAKNLPYYSQVPELGQTKYNIPVFIQPMDQCDQTLNKENEQLAIELALKYGYRLSLQIHKILKIE
ncbi:MAG: 7-carboxy-7-deazaguanine synthase QueE [Rickettsia endosymbiont of Bryobia graminum]|nr:7-carboxy-7-deazaguanine synthase QueE [Rickettsia endosymbiont of Bryobia graminum]